MRRAARPCLPALAVLALLLTACAGRRADPSVQPTPEVPDMGVYRGRLEETGAKPRRFRLLLFAAAPDRVHGEVVSAIGSTEMIVDGGGGRLAITVVRDKVAYVGDADPAALGKILGIRLGLDELVHALLEGQAGDDRYSVVRTEENSGGLPERIEFRSADTVLMLELKKRKPLRGASAELGTGSPPAGVELLPLSELAASSRVGEVEPPTGSTGG